MVRVFLIFRKFNFVVAFGMGGVSTFLFYVRFYSFINSTNSRMDVGKIRISCNLLVSKFSTMSLFVMCAQCFICCEESFRWKLIYLNVAIVNYTLTNFGSRKVFLFYILHTMYNCLPTVM